MHIEVYSTPVGFVCCRGGQFAWAVQVHVVRGRAGLSAKESLDLFSDKQQRYLSSTECPIMARLTARDVAAVFEEDMRTTCKQCCAAALTMILVSAALASSDRPFV